MIFWRVNTVLWIFLKSQSAPLSFHDFFHGVMNYLDFLDFSWGGLSFLELFAFSMSFPELFWFFWIFWNFSEFFEFSWIFWFSWFFWIFWIYFDFSWFFSLGPPPDGRVQKKILAQAKSLQRCETVETNLHSLCRFEHGWGSQTTFPSMKGRVNRALTNTIQMIVLPFASVLYEGQQIFCIALCLGFYIGQQIFVLELGMTPLSVMTLWSDPALDLTAWPPCWPGSPPWSTGEMSGRLRAGRWWGSRAGSWRERFKSKKIQVLIHYNNPNTKPPRRGV